MVYINLKKLPPVTEDYSWPLRNPPVSMWAEAMTSFCVLCGVFSLKKPVVAVSCFCMVWEKPWKQRKRSELEKMSLDPYRIRSSEMLDLSILLDSGHEYLILQLSMMKGLAKTGGRIRRGNDCF